MNNIDVNVKLDEADKATLDKILEVVSCIYLAITTQPSKDGDKDIQITTADTLLEKNTAPNVTFEQVRAVLAGKSRAGFTKQVRELLLKHGASKLSEIPKSRYENLLIEAEGLGNE